MKKEVSLPLYQQIKEDIKLSIENGRFKPNDKIPAENDLSQEYSASRITIRRAVEELSREGYLVKKQGVGTFVSKPRIHRKMASGSGLESFTETCEKQGITSGAKLVRRQIVPARKDEAEFLKLNPDELLIYVERIRYANDIPIFIENQFLPYTEFKELLNCDLNNTSLYGIIEEISGRKPTHSQKLTLEATTSTNEQSKKLGIKTNEPLLYMNSYVLDQNDKPICIGRQYYIGSRYMFDL